MTDKKISYWFGVVAKVVDLRESLTLYVSKGIRFVPSTWEKVERSASADSADKIIRWESILEGLDHLGPDPMHLRDYRSRGVP